jgi:hypothetical protein
VRRRVVLSEKFGSHLLTSFIDKGRD